MPARSRQVTYSRKEDDDSLPLGQTRPHRTHNERRPRRGASHASRFLLSGYGSITIVQTTVRGDGSIRMSSCVTESSQPVAGVVSAVVPVFVQVIDVALVSPEPPSRKFT